MIIYKVTNLINGKVYVGKTVKDLDRRKRQHKHNALTRKVNTYFCKAIRKYGWDNFGWEIIDESDNNDSLNEREIYWISFYNSTDNSKGYNLTNGGASMVGFKHSKESRKKMSKAHKGIKLSKEHIENLRKSSKKRRGKNHHFYGKRHSEEALIKMSKNRKGKSVGEQHKISKLKNIDVIEIKNLLMSGVPQRKIAKMYDVSKTAIASIQYGETWSHVKVEGFTEHVKEQGCSNSKLKDKDIREIKKLLKIGEKSQKEIALMFSVSNYAICDIKREKTWSHIKIEDEKEEEVTVNV